jgi:hypothetical protein
MKLTGREGKFYTDQERNDARQNHANTHSHKPHYRKSVTFGKEFLESYLSVKNAVAVKFEFADHADGRETLIPVPLDQYGNELPIPKFKPKKTKPDVTTYDDPPHCPPQC